MTADFEQEAENILRQIATHWKRPGDCDLDPAFIALALRAAYEKGFEACREAAAKVVCKRCAEGRPLRGDCHQWNEHDWAMCLALSIRGALTPTNADKTEGK